MLKDEFFGIDFASIPTAANAKMSDEMCDVPVMACVSLQKLCTVYDPEQALMQGTLFPELDKPFMGGMPRG